MVGSSEFSATDFFLEEHPDSRIRIVPVDDQWDPDKSPVVIKEAMAQGVQFFIASHPFKYEIASIHLFRDSPPLIINTGFISLALTGIDRIRQSQTVLADTR